MSNELPPLPAHFAYCYEWVTQTGGVRRSFSGAPYNGVGATTSFPLYTESHLREYGQARERAAYERAAQLCEERAGTVSMFASSKESGTHNRAVRGCAAAIRALGADK